MTGTTRDGGVGKTSAGQEGGNRSGLHQAGQVRQVRYRTHDPDDTARWRLIPGDAGGSVVPEQFWLSESQVDYIAPTLPRSRGRARVDDRRVLSGIIHVIRSGVRWCDSPLVYGPRKTLYNRHVSWRRNGVFDQIFVALAKLAGLPANVIRKTGHLSPRSAAPCRR